MKLPISFGLFSMGSLIVASTAFAGEHSSSPSVRDVITGTRVVRPLGTVSVGATASARSMTHGRSHMAAQVALIDTTTVTNSIAKALTELGVAYDEYSTSDFSAIDLTPYESVIVGMDGGGIEDASIANIQTFATAGGNVLFVGGTCYQPFALAVEARLLDIDSVNYCWTTVGGSPHMTVTNASHKLAKNLPATYDFLDINATYYMARNEDGGATVAAVNGDGYDCLLSKTVGAGTFHWFTSSAYEGYWTNDADYQVLKQIVKNALSKALVAVIDTTSVGGSVLQSLNDLGVPFDEYFGDDFSAIDLSPYQTVIVAMDGGLVGDPSIANIQGFANSGGNLVMVGGTSWQDFVDAVDARLLDNDTVTYGWTTVSGSPHLSVTDAGHRLAQGVPATYNFADLGASYYMLHSQDTVAHVAAINGDGFDDLLSKPLGSGRLSWFLNSPYDGYWTDPSDYAVLRQVIKDSLCYVSGSSSNYGAGWPGTSGVPSLTVSETPVVGQYLTINIGNSLGANTPGILLLGLSSANISTNLDGSLLVLFSWIFPLPVIAGGGISITSAMPDVASLIGASIYLQVLEADGGATKGVSFSQGLQAVFGDC